VIRTLNLGETRCEVVKWTEVQDRVHSLASVKMKVDYRVPENQSVL
jgi:hypothetical protein